MIIIVFSIILLKFGPKLIEIVKNSDFSFSRKKTEEELLRDDLDYLLDIITNDHSIAYLNSHYRNVNLQKMRNHYEVAFEKEEKEFIPLLETILGGQKDPDSFLLDTGSLEEIASLDRDSKMMNSFFLDETVKKEARSIPFPLKEAHNLELITPVPGKTASIKINSFDQRKLESDGRQIRDFLEKIENYDLLIIDIRGAGGYSIDYFLENLVKPFIREELTMTGQYLYKEEEYEKHLSSISPHLTLYPGKPIREKKDSLHLSEDLLKFFEYIRTFEISIQPEDFSNFYGKIYLLQDHETKNAPDLFSQFANITGFATTCGEYTMGFGLNLLPSFVKLPHSQYIVAFSSRLGLNSDGSLNPDIGTEAKIKLENKDTFQQLMEIIH